MINTIAALQGLYVALGGDIGDVANINTIPDMLEAIASVAGGAGGALPAVTSEDNGDILGVVEGAWAKRDPELPAVNGDDNGKILGVNNGAWDAVAAPLPTVAAADIGEALIVESDGEGGAQWGKGAVPSDNVIYNCTFTSGVNVAFPSGVTGNNFFTDIANGKTPILKVFNSVSDTDPLFTLTYSGTSNNKRFFSGLIGEYDNVHFTDKYYIGIIGISSASTVSAAIIKRELT